jgi:hypothetical protein
MLETLLQNVIQKIIQVLLCVTENILGFKMRLYEGTFNFENKRMSHGAPNQANMVGASAVSFFFIAKPSCKLLSCVGGSAVSICPAKCEVCICCVAADTSQMKQPLSGWEELP